MKPIEKVLKALRDKVQTAVSEFKYPRHVVEVRISDHIVQVETFQQPIQEVPPDQEADGEVFEMEDIGLRYEVIEDTNIQAQLVDHFHEYGFVTGRRYQSGIEIAGWPCQIESLQSGDYIRFFKWKTPVKVANIYPPGEAIEDKPFNSLSSSGLSVTISGDRGAAYVFHRGASETQVSFYREASNRQSGLEKANEDITFQFIGNPDTGPRRLPESAKGEGYDVRSP